MNRTGLALAVALMLCLPTAGLPRDLATTRYNGQPLRAYALASEREYFAELRKRIRPQRYDPFASEELRIYDPTESAWSARFGECCAIVLRPCRGWKI